MWADGVIEGGGIKVIGLVGALSVAEKKGFRWKRLAGTSAGSIVATLLAAGYTSDELYQLLMDKDFNSLIRPTWYHQIPYFGPALRLWVKKGLYSGRELENWIADLLLQKGIRTFADMDEQMELSIIASDISRGKLVVLPKDLPAYGYSKEQMTVAKAVRMSCSIPFFFDPVKMIHKSSNKPSYLVDGAVLSNFPVWLFDEETPRWPTLGFRLYSNAKETVHEIKGPLSLFYSMFLTMMDAHDNRHILEQDQLRTISVPAVGVKLTDFSLSKSKKQRLYQSGIHAAEAFFQNWTFDQYLEARRKVNHEVTYTIRSSSDIQEEKR